MKKNSNFFLGMILIFLGVAFIVCRVFDIHIFRPWQMWPLFLLIPGLLFEFSYFSTKRNPGLLVPGGILTTIGCLFFFEIITRWKLSKYTWPIYLLAVAIGLFQLYWFGKREKALLIPIGILAAIIIMSYSSMFFGSLYSWGVRTLLLPVLLIVIGLCLVLKGDKNKIE